MWNVPVNYVHKELGRTCCDGLCTRQSTIGQPWTVFSMGTVFTEKGHITAYTSSIVHAKGVPTGGAMLAYQRVRHDTIIVLIAVTAQYNKCQPLSAV